MTELEELRERVARLEKTQADYRDPNVLLLEGKLSTYGGEFSALSVSTQTGEVYLAEVVEKLAGWRDIVTFQFHISSEPKTFYELEENLVKTVMGKVDSHFYHSYSDLTGYLWTNEKLEIGEHDVLSEIQSHMNQGTGSKYIALRVERKPK